MQTAIAQLYSDLFTPEYFVLLCTLLLLGTELQPRLTFSRVLSRVGVIGVAWGLAFAVYKAAPYFFIRTPSWGEDLFGGLGLALGFVLIWGMWSVHQWSFQMREFSLLLIVVSLVHSVITPFWDISSHVMYAAAPAGFLSLNNRRLRPLLVIPVGMVVSRPLVGAHTWLQSISGFVVAGLLVLGFAWLRPHTSARFSSYFSSQRTKTR